MLTSQEPRDGDFVAYIEQLQRESAARIHAQSQVRMVELPANAPPRTGAPRPAQLPPSGSVPAGQATRRGSMSGDESPPLLDRRQAEEMLARLARSGASSHNASAGIALAIGAVLLLTWFAFDTGALPFLIGLGLTLWAVSRLRRAARQPASTAGPRGRDQVSHIFGPRPPTS
jgi:hypothetical protein